eukprot:g13520.t1
MAANASTLEQELYSTVGDKQVFLVRLRQLRSEVRLVEASLEALQQKEDWLTRELAKRSSAREDLPSVDDFLEGKASAEGTRFFELEDPAEDRSVCCTHHAHNSSACQDGDQDEHSQADDWERLLDAMGVARCGSCGTRLPLDMAAIEQHSKECPASPTRAMGGPALLATPEPPDEDLMGRCSHCGEFVRLAMQCMEQHTCRQSIADQKA